MATDALMAGQFAVRVDPAEIEFVTRPPPAKPSTVVLIGDSTAACPFIGKVNPRLGEWLDAQRDATTASLAHALPGITNATVAAIPHAAAETPWHLMTNLFGLVRNYRGRLGSDLVVFVPGELNGHPARQVGQALTLGLVRGAQPPLSLQQDSHIVEPLRCVVVWPAAGEYKLHDRVQDAELARQANLVHALGDLPPNLLFPQRLAEIAAECLQRGEVEVSTRLLTDPAELAAAWPLTHAIGQASVRPPAVLEAHYRGRTGRDCDLILTGKGVTFDAGGLKVKADMTDMHRDMTGAASALALMTLLVARRPPLNVTLLLPCIENMPGPGALRPHDVVCLADGRSIRIEDPDAEGRLLLAEAVARARLLAPRWICTFGTIHRALSFAAGEGTIGLFARARSLAGFLRQCDLGGLERFLCVTTSPLYEDAAQDSLTDLRQTGSGRVNFMQVMSLLEAVAGASELLYVELSGATCDDALPTRGLQRYPCLFGLPTVSSFLGVTFGEAALR